MDVGEQLDAADLGRPRCRRRGVVLLLTSHNNCLTPTLDCCPHSTGPQAAAVLGGAITSPTQSVVYYVEVYRHGENSPASYYRMRVADHVETVKALFRAGLGSLRSYPAEQAGPSGVSRVSAKIRWRRRERNVGGGLVDSYGGYTSSYHYRNGDYEEAIESLSAVGFVNFDKMSDAD